VRAAYRFALGLFCDFVFIRAGPRFHVSGLSLRARTRRLETETKKFKSVRRFLLPTVCMSADVALAHMERAVAEYGRINQRLHKALHASRAHTAEVAPRACSAHAVFYAHLKRVCRCQLVAARTGVKASFIAHKTQFRRAVTALTSVSAAARATARLTELQAAYRACNQVRRRDGLAVHRRACCWG
jgi:hypothetical protein